MISFVIITVISVFFSEETFKKADVS
jgi:hypothetical protein